MTDEQLGMLFMGIMALTIILIVRWFIRSAKKSYRDNWWNKMVGSRSINGWIFLVMHLCMEPFSKDIKGKNFFTIDWEEMKEKHKLTPTKKFKNKVTQELLKKLVEADIKFSLEGIDTINRIFFAEIDDVVKDIDNQLQYVQKTWIKNPTGDDMLMGFTVEFKKLWANKQFTMPYADMHMFGYKVIQLLDKILREQRINAAFRGELEVEDEPVYEEEYDSEDYYEPWVAAGYVAGSSSEKPMTKMWWDSDCATPIEHKPFPERKPAAQPKPRPEPVRQKVFKVQRMDRGGGWSTKYSTNNIRIAENQMRNFQNGAYKLQDERQPNVRWRIVDEDDRMVL